MVVQRVLPLRECLKWYLQNLYLPTLPKNVRALLERWFDHPDAEKIWNTIRAHSEQHDGPIGIDEILLYCQYPPMEGSRERRAR